MNQNSRFKRTKLCLTCYYAEVMKVILSISGLGVYEAIAHAHWSTLDREIESVAGALHDSLETVLKQLFDRFYRVDSDRSRKTGGSGLRLAIVKTHRGSIEVESQPGIGSIFTVLIPLKPTATFVSYAKGKGVG